MRDLSFFLFKNSFGAKMKKGFRNSCNGDGSTSTLNQHNLMPTATSSSSPEKPPTLEEMILQLEFEEEMARRAKQQQLNDDNDVVVEQQYGRMSCVNNSDILRSARNALNQYPRFSLDGRDAMYRSSFRNLDSYNGGRRSVCCDHRLQERLLYQTGYNANNFGGGASKMEKSSNKCNLPATLGGESVVWCKPGVVAKLMGLEAMPVPLMNTKLLQDCDKDHQQVMMTMKRHNLRRRAEKHEMERRLAMDMNNNNCDGSRMSTRRRTVMGSCSKADHCVVKPLAVEPVDGGGGWPTGRFR